MSMSSANRVPRVPTLPQGETVAQYVTYLEAQKAVDHLADNQFPVQHVTIVGSDLKTVERVLRRLSYPSVALGGFASGAWFGLFVGLIFTLFSPSALSIMIPAILFGGAFGLLFSVITYAFTRGRRDFTSTSQIVATSYSILCATEQAGKARQLLAAVGGVVSGWPGAAPVPAPAGPIGTAPSDPASSYPPPAAPPAPPTPGATPPNPAPPAPPAA